MAICKWCGSLFNKKQNREEYCCDNCKIESAKEKSRIRRMNHYYRTKNIPSFSNYKKNLGSGSLSQHMVSNHELELKLIRKEKERLKI